MLRIILAMHLSHLFNTASNWVYSHHCKRFLIWFKLIYVNMHLISIYWINIWLGMQYYVMVLSSCFYTDIFCITVKTFGICNHNNLLGVFCSASIHILELLCSFSCNLSAYTVNSHFFDSGVYSWLSFSTNQMVCQQENPWMT